MRPKSAIYTPKRPPSLSYGGPPGCRLLSAVSQWPVDRPPQPWRDIINTSHRTSLDNEICFTKRSSVYIAKEKVRFLDIHFVIVTILDHKLTVSIHTLFARVNIKFFGWPSRNPACLSSSTYWCLRFTSWIILGFLSQKI